MTRHRTSYLDSVHALMHAPRTRKELSECLGLVGRNTVDSHLAAMRKLGLVYVQGYRRCGSGPLTKVFGWQPTPFALPDAPKTYPSALAQQVLSRIDRELEAVEARGAK